MNQLIEPRGAPKQIIAYLLASRFYRLRGDEGSQFHSPLL